MQPNFADDIPKTDWNNVSTCCEGGRCTATVQKPSTCAEVQVNLSIEPTHVPPGVEVLTSQPVPSGGHPEFERILDELWDLHLRKGADYGTDADCLANIRTSAEFGVEPWRYAILRANEKVSRLKRFARDKTLANEMVEDSLLDLASQAILALVLLRE